MDAVKFLQGIIDENFDSLSPLSQVCLACAMGIISHLGWVASVVALFVVLFQLKASFYRSRREKLAYENICKGENDEK